MSGRWKSPKPSLDGLNAQDRKWVQSYLAAEESLRQATTALLRAREAALMALAREPSRTLSPDLLTTRAKGHVSLSMRRQMHSCTQIEQISKELQCTLQEHLAEDARGSSRDQGSS